MSDTNDDLIENENGDSLVDPIDPGNLPVDYDVYQKITDPADPKRCQANNAHGQCSFIKIPGSDYCHVHGGSNGMKKKSLQNYRLARWQMRTAELANSEGVKSLRDEIGILRMMLEEKLNQVDNVTELMVVSHVISDLILKIEKVVMTCHKIEKSMGELLDRSDILTIASQIISAIEAEISDQTTVAKLSGRIEQIVLSSKGSIDSDEE